MLFSSLKVTRCEKMSVQETLEAVKELSPEEREQVKRLLDSLPQATDSTRAVQLPMSDCWRRAQCLK